MSETAPPALPARHVIRPKRSRRRRWRVVISIGVVLVLLIGGVVGYNLYLNGEIHRLTVKNLSGGPGSGTEAGTENILLVGSTSRCALKVQNPAFGLCSQGVTGVNGDVIMILHLDPATHRLTILSIPRDLFVPNARLTGANKIDAALYEGPGQLVNVIQEDFGIPIQHYVELNFDTFAGVVNALGGVRMYFPMPVFDAYSGLRVMTPGCHSLNGFQALAVVRARHLQYKGPGVTSNNPHTWPQEVQSDIARIRRDHEFLRVLAATVARRGLGNPVRDEQIAAAVAPQLQVDSGLSALGLAHLIYTFHSVNPFGAPELTLPVVVTTFGSYIYQGGDYGDVEFTSEPQDQAVIDKFLGVGPNTNTLTGAQLPAPSAVSVSVLNGSGVASQAADTAASLHALGFRIAGVGNAVPVATHSETMVAYAGAATEADAMAVAHKLTGFVVLDHNPALVSNGAQVTVVTGTSFAVTSPPPSATSSAPSSPSTAAPTAAPTQYGASAGYQPPTAPVQALRPWDPRSCTASGGEGP